jgi:hypothetical protein
LACFAFSAFELAFLYRVTYATADAVAERQATDFALLNRSIA